MLPACRFEKTTNAESNPKPQVQTSASSAPLRETSAPPTAPSRFARLLFGSMSCHSAFCVPHSTAPDEVTNCDKKLRLQKEFLPCPVPPDRTHETERNDVERFRFFSADAVSPRRMQPHATQCSAQQKIWPRQNAPHPASGTGKYEIWNRQSPRPAGRPGTRDQPSVGARRGHPADGFAGCRVAGARAPTASPMRSRRKMQHCRGGCCGGCSRLPARPTAAGRAARAAGPARGACQA
jgi:hypothetical protein